MEILDMETVFTRYPAGRMKIDGPFSGEKFRDEILVPRLKIGKKFQINLDSALGYGSSFLEEAFGGVVRVHKFKPEIVLGLIDFLSSDAALVSEIKDYIIEAGER